MYPMPIEPDLANVAEAQDAFAQDGVQLYAVSRTGPCPAGWWRGSLEQVPLADRARIMKYCRQKDRENALLATQLSRKILAGILNLPVHALAVERDSRGRPYLKGISTWCGDFNISHSGEWVVCAVAKTGAVGVDVQEIRPISVEAIEYSLTREETQALTHAPADRYLSGFYQLWTLKEAYVKALGIGLSLPFTSFGFKLGQTVALHHTPVADAQAWHFQQYNLGPGYCLALCANQPVLPARVVVLDREELFQ